MRRLVVFLMLFVFLAFSSQSYAFFGFGNEKKIQECKVIVEKMADFIVKNLDKPYNSLSDEEKKKYQSLYGQLVRCRKNAAKAYNVIYTKNPVSELKGDRFAVVFFISQSYYAPVLKQIYGGSIETGVFNRTFRKVSDEEKLLRELDKETEKKFCYVTGAKISCPAFHLEKDFWNEIAGNSRGVTFNVLFYEVMRKIIPWLNKEFGPDARGLLPVISK